MPAHGLVLEVSPDVRAGEVQVSADYLARAAGDKDSAQTGTDSRTTSTGKGTTTQTNKGARAPAAAPVPLTAEQKTHITVVGAVCGAVSAVGSPTPLPCQPSTPGATGVPAGQKPPARPQVTVAQVRQSAVDQITMVAPEIGASPCLADPASCKGTVGVPVWLWVGDGNGALPSESATATAGPYSITATAKVSKVKWSLGDGQSTVCSGTGTKYVSDVHGWSSPHCGFERGWKEAGMYTLTASYVWDISWSGDQAGSATQTMSSTQQVTVGELQAVAKSTN